MLIVEFSVTPIQHKMSTNEEIAKVIEMIARSGLTFEIGPMGTSIEGDPVEVMAVLGRCIEELRRDSTRFDFTIRGEYEEGREKRLEKRVEEVVDEVLSHDPQVLHGVPEVVQ